MLAGMAQGRRRANAAGRTVRRVVKLTPDEDAELERRADAAGVTVARLLVESATGSAPTPDRRVIVSELMGLRRQVQGIGTNVNQLAHAANAGVVLGRDELADAAAAVVEALAAIERALTR